ncbi:uridine diphosphate glucose pyrophosphatase NUDT14-like [Brevipalpus obovatus]|uniref:uridine diphosphate glucose pyrophosphatase NUDT14-like n=1 Tax=Brevipalpus obovatus TaxID=246614 RepID=UPI003D9E65E6
MSDEGPKIVGIFPIGPQGTEYVRPFRLLYTLDGSDDKPREWDCLKTHDSVAIILYNTDHDTLIFVRQFRPSIVAASALELDIDKGVIRPNPKVSGYSIELCAGIIDKEGKNAAEIAKEEVLEETGYDIPTSSLQFVTSSRSGIGVQAAVHSIFFATVCDKQKTSRGGGIDDERIEVIELSIEESRKLLWAKEEEAINARPASMLCGIAWFMYEKYPSIKKK